MHPVGWQKSSHSGGTTGNECVELASADGRIRVRESDKPGVVLATTPGSLRELIRGIKADEFHPHLPASRTASPRSHPNG